MLGLNPDLMWCVHRVRTEFRDDIGNRRAGTGTGFWIHAGGRDVFVTNRHNVDPTIKFPKDPGLSLASLEIELRQWTRSATPVTKFFGVIDPLKSSRSSSAADCTILVDPMLTGWDQSFPILSIIKPKDLVTGLMFDDGVVGPMETALFLGFPGASGQQWWDDQWNMPVARQCVLSSLPKIPFMNKDIATSDTVLVSGLSFAGASGSPVLLPARGIAPGGDIHDPNWRTALLVGLMSGHFWERQDMPEMFRHTGLSYMTRSSSICDLLGAAGLR